ncbi:hypothetical protein GRX31_23395 [Delftia sp. CH05]|nr:hypothetical protein [Delftia sp. CH05]
MPAISSDIPSLNPSENGERSLRALKKPHSSLRVANTTSSQAPAEQLCSLPSWHDDL